MMRKSTLPESRLALTFFKEIIMKWILLILLFSIPLQAKTYRVAVIDTGLQKKYISEANLCIKGHKSFVKGETIVDNHGHGTNIVGLIKKNAGNADYCIVIVKYYSTYNPAVNMKNLIKALDYASTIKPDIINLSLGGGGIIVKERLLIRKLLNAGTIINAAAGNEYTNLDNNCNYYPACYDKRINVISAKDFDSANKGHVVSIYVDGKDRSAFGFKMTGTSQSTAVYTGMLIRGMK